MSISVEKRMKRVNILWMMFENSLNDVRNGMKCVKYPLNDVWKCKLDHCCELNHRWKYIGEPMFWLIMSCDELRRPLPPRTICEFKQEFILLLVNCHGAETNFQAPYAVGFISSYTLAGSLNKLSIHLQLWVSCGWSCDPFEFLGCDKWS